MKTMQLIITSEDFRKLSAATRRELLSILSGDEWLEDYPPVLEDQEQVVEVTAPNESERKVVGIHPEQAQELLSNLADKSQQTLRLFALNEYVEIDDLVGNEKPYKDMNDLKRSFVGAVNRRLRTVLGNRMVVLFSSNRDRTRIKVLPITASALRWVYKIESNSATIDDATSTEDEFSPEFIN